MDRPRTILHPTIQSLSCFYPRRDPSDNRRKHSKMNPLIEIVDKAKTRQLIFEAKGGILTEEESKVLEQYLTFSAKLCIGSVDGKLCCAWGLIPPSMLSERAYLWLFSTELVGEHKFMFVRNSQIAVK